MANNSNRDYLQVKDNNLSRSNKGVSNKIDHDILAKLSRCELEDKLLKLLDEQTHLKKLVNCQEEKIKRLGAKLLRIIGEKKNGRKNLEQSEEMQIKIIELEHENYTLKDKNIVLKQQLANHSRHSAHLSPIRSIHTSPVTSIRANEALHNDNTGESGEKNVSAETKLKNAENLIQELNKEIKTLHCKITFLQQEIEKNSIDNRKIKVTENIELIRLQRSLKQQAIQIAALQGQVKNSEVNQRILKEDLTKAHKDNEEALYLISVKQNEILTLCAKLEEKNLSKLEENELRERINDLVVERNSLKERSDFLIKTIGVKETEQVEELKKLLAEEKLEKKKLELVLESMQKKLKNYQDSSKETNEFVSCYCHENNPINCSDSSNSKNDDDDSVNNKIPVEIFKGKCYEEKIKMERESQYLRDMLKMQTAHCEAQQKEISRLMLELKVNEDKCNETLQRLDSHLKLFHHLEKKNKEDNIHYKTSSERKQSSFENYHSDKLQSSDLGNMSSTLDIKSEKNKTNEWDDFKTTDNITLASKDYYSNKNNILSKETSNKKSSSNISIHSDEEISFRKDNSGDNLRNIVKSSSSQKLTSKIIKPEQMTDTLVEKNNKINESEGKKRFIDQVFLESSEEEDTGEEIKSGAASIKESSLKKFELPLEEKESSVIEKNSFKPTRLKEGNLWDPAYKIYSDGRNSSTSFSSKLSSESSSIRHEKKKKFSEKKNIDLIQSPKMGSLFEQKLAPKKDTIEVSILWLKIEPNSFLFTDKNIKLLFVDFSFLDVKGEETETPESLVKPKSPEEKCNFNFTTGIKITEEKKIMLNSLLSKPESNLVIFKIVSEPDSSNDDLECEDIGMAVVTAQLFLEKYNTGPFVIPVTSLADPKELLGQLAVKFQGSN